MTVLLPPRTDLEPWERLCLLIGKATVTPLNDEDRDEALRLICEMRRKERAA